MSKFQDFPGSFILYKISKTISRAGGFVLYKINKKNVENHSKNNYFECFFDHNKSKPPKNCALCAGGLQNPKMLSPVGFT